MYTHNRRPLSAKKCNKEIIIPRYNDPSIRSKPNISSPALSLPNVLEVFEIRVINVVHLTSSNKSSISLITMFCQLQ